MDIRDLTIKMELKKKKFRCLLNEASRLASSFHDYKMKKTG